MPDFSLTSTEITTMVYPTEVEEKVRGTLAKLSGEGIEVKEERFTSHYGYSFKILTAKLDSKKSLSLLRELICGLSDSDFLTLIETLENHLDRRDLYLRLSKQDLALGKMRMYKGGPGGYVRIRISFRKVDPTALKEYLRGLREAECMRI